MNTDSTPTTTDPSARKAPEKQTPQEIYRAVQMKWTPIFWASVLLLTFMVLGGFAGIAFGSDSLFLPSLVTLCLSPVVIFFGATASNKLAEIARR